MNIRDLGDRAWPVLGRVSDTHTLIYRLTHGLIGHRMPGSAPSMLLLDHVGARSGTRRTTPLVYLPDGDDLVIVASKGGHPRHPAWYHNLRAHPDTWVQVGSERRPVRARVATAEERPRLWALAVAAWRDYATYQARTDRAIPLVVLERRPA